MAAIGTFVDNFDGTTLNPVLWGATDTADAFGFQADSYYFTVRSGTTGDTYITSVANYDLTASHVHIEIPNMGAQESGLETYPLILTTSTANLNNCLLFVVSNGTMGMYEIVGGVPNGLAFVTYNSTNHRWLRFREAAGLVYFEAAPDGVTWTTLTSVAPTIAITALFVRVRTLVFSTLATSKTTQFDNLNYMPVPEPDFPNGAIPVGMQLAFNANLEQNAWDWTWTDVSHDFMDQTWTVQRGRPDEASDVGPTRSNITLDNPTADYTPDHPTGAYYPYVRLGVPARVWVEYGDARLYIPPDYGTSAQVEATSALDITGDLDVRLDFHLQTTGQLSGVAWNAVVVGVADNSDEYGWRIEVTDARFIQLHWSSDGVPGGGNSHIATSTVPVLPFNSRAILRVTLDINNGAAGHDVAFYLGESITGPWTQIGTTVTGTGVTSVFPADEPLIISGSPELNGVFNIDADVYYLQVRDGIGGTLVVDANFEDVPSGSPAWADATGLLWETTGAAAFTNRWYRITGSVDEWAPRWPYGDLSSQQNGGLGEGEARADLDIAGILRRLGQGQAPLKSALNLALSTHADIRAYWPGEDLDGSTVIASGIPGGSPMNFTGSIDFSSADGLPGSEPLMTLSATSSLNGLVGGGFSGNWIVGLYHNIPSGPGASTTIFRATATGSISEWRFTCTNAEVRLTGFNSMGTQVFTQNSAPPSFFFGQWVHTRLFVQTDGTNVDWSVVWFPVTIPPSSGSFIANTFAGTTGQPTSVGVPAAAGIANIGYGQIYVAAAIDIQQNSAQIGWAGENAITRMARLCAQENISMRIIGDDGSSELMGVQGTGTLLELLSEAAVTDGGILYEQPDNIGLIYRSFDSMYNQPANMVLDGIARQYVNPVEPLLDDLRIRNDITVTRKDGSSVRVVDDTNIAEHGRYDEQVTVNTYQDSQLADIAAWRLHQGTVPGMRYPSMTTNLGVSDELIPDWFTVDVATKIEVTNLPPQHPTDARELIIQGYSEPISPVTWKPQMVCAPASVWDVLELSEDWVGEEYEFRVDTDGSLLADPADTTDTTLQVTPSGVPSLVPYWTTDPVEFPFDINIGGERMTVSDIDAPTGGEELSGAGNASISASTSFVAPSVVAPGSTDLLICAWQSYEDISTFTLPGGMTPDVLTGGTFSVLEDATQVLGSSGATGTRTATFGASDTWSAISVVAHSTGTPVIEELLTGYGFESNVTLTTILPVQRGSWVLAIQGWDWDPADTMGPPPGGPWIPIADSALASDLTSRIRAWAFQVINPGIRSITFEANGWVTDNHARLYILSNLDGITQQFTVTRSVNGIVKSHEAQSSVELWFHPVIAR